MAKVTQASAKKRATALHSRLIRALGYCQNCGKTEHLQCAHIISRRYAATRTDLDNAFCLCAGCHMRFTEHADEWMTFVYAQIGLPRFVALKAKALEGAKVDWICEAQRLAVVSQSTERVES